MNTNYLKVKIEIPIDYNNPDMNGAIYTKEAYAKAMTYGTTSLPLIIYDSEGKPVPIGAGDIELKEDKLIFNGCIWSGGFSCSIDDMDIKDKVAIIKDMKFESIGFDCKVNEPPSQIGGK